MRMYWAEPLRFAGQGTRNRNFTLPSMWTELD